MQLKINADDKEVMVAGFSGGRECSSKFLTSDEANAMIRHLQQLLGNKDDKANNMRRKMISYAHQLHWHLPGTQKPDMPRLNAWCKQYGYLHKPLNEYTYKELPKLVSQFKAVFADILNKL